ncbi:MAG: hypothetical protein LRZ84_14420 [Desertifilum sp.]|nr:hypothetical protein [Desertifilum sp.]
MTRSEFCKAFIHNSAEQAMAMAILPDTEMELPEWQRMWTRTLRSPAG